MQPLAQHGYLGSEVRDALLRRTGTSTMTFWYEHLDQANRRLGDLTNVLSGSVTHDYLADIKRTATFTLADTGGINYLSDRIRPWARIALPRTIRTFGDELDAVPNRLLRWQFDEPSGAAAAVDVSGNNRSGTVSGGVTTGRPALVATGSAYGFDTTTAATVSASGAGTWLGGVDRVTVVSWIKADSTGHDRGWLSGTTPSASGDRSLGARFAATGPLGSATDCIRVWVQLDDPGSTIVAAETGPRTATTETTSVIWSWQSGVGIRVWLNGQPADLSGKANFTAIGSLAGVDMFVVGRSPDSGKGGFGGTVDDVSVYSAMIDDATALRIHRAGTATGPYGTSNFAEWPQGVFLLTSPTRKADPNGVVTREVKAYDQGLILKDDKTTNRYAAASGTLYTDQVTTVLTGAGITDVNLTPSSLVIPTTIEWDPGTPKLTVVNDLLAAINYESIWFDEHGQAVVQPYVSPQVRPSQFVYTADTQSVITPGVEQTLDLFGVPNKWVLVVSEPDRGPLTSTFSNNDPASPTSIPSRGRTIVEVRTGQQAPTLVVLDELAARAGFRASQVYEEITLPTGLMPIHSHNEVITLVYPDLGVSENYSERQWVLPLKAGATMQHIIRRIVSV
jgi:hypothetical protein